MRKTVALLPLLSWIVVACLTVGVDVASAHDVPDGLKKGKPIGCIGSGAINVTKRAIKTKGIAVDSKGSCNITITKSHLTAGNVAIKVMGSGPITIHDSHVHGGKVAIDIMGSGDVKLHNCHIQGPVAVRLMGSGNVYANNCTIKGRVVKLGTGRFFKKGGPAKQKAPEAEAPKTSAGSGAVPEGLRRAKPVVCKSDQTITLKKRYINTPENGIRASENCTVILVGCRIVAGGYALRLSGNSTAKIRNSHVEGKKGAARISGNSDLKAKGSTIKGRIRKSGNADFTNEGGNKISKR